MKSTLKFALVVISFAFLTACGGASTPTETPVDSTATAAPVTETPAPVVADTTATTPADTTKKAQ